MHRILTRLDDLAAAVANSPFRAIQVGSVGAGGGALPWAAQAGHIHLMLQIAATLIGLFVGLISLVVMVLSLQKALAEKRERVARELRRQGRRRS
jgi:hypothetical protein